MLRGQDLVFLMCLYGSPSRFLKGGGRVRERDVVTMMRVRRGSGMHMRAAAAGLPIAQTIEVPPRVYYSNNAPEH